VTKDSAQDRFSELCNQRDRLIQQYLEHLDPGQQAQERSRIALYLVHGEDHLAAINVPRSVRRIQVEIKKHLAGGEHDH
jgi:cellobiose-specific phosphotransferase system component IIA